MALSLFARMFEAMADSSVVVPSETTHAWQVVESTVASRVESIYYGRRMA